MVADPTLPSAPAPSRVPHRTFNAEHTGDIVSNVNAELGVPHTVGFPAQPTSAGLRSGGAPRRQQSRAAAAAAGGTRRELLVLAAGPIPTYNDGAAPQTAGELGGAGRHQRAAHHHGIHVQPPGLDHCAPAWACRRHTRLGKWEYPRSRLGAQCQALLVLSTV